MSASAATEALPMPTLRVGTSGDYPPFSLSPQAPGDGPTDRFAPEGFDIEVAQRMARELGFDLDLHPFAWPQLTAGITEGRFDLAMSGVTWRPERAVHGWMSRAVAAGSPCMVSTMADADPPRRLVVNRGGVLEQWARKRFGGEAGGVPTEVIAVDDNLSLPDRLERGEVDALVTDSFEVRHFSRDGWRFQCEPPLDRKVYWVAPHQAEQLGPAVDAWIQRNEAWLRHRREAWFGDVQARSDIAHLLDLAARRLAFMPAVAAWKAERKLTIEDPEREQQVLKAAAAQAVKRGLNAAAVRTWFAHQIDLAKAVQRRSTNTKPTLALERIRPVLIRLGERQVETLQAIASSLSKEPELAHFQVLRPWLTEPELVRLRNALLELLRKLNATSALQPGR